MREAPIAGLWASPWVSLWWRDVRWPLAAFGFTALWISLFDLDLALARWAFFDAATLHWRGAGTWWADDLIHDAGRWFVRVIAACAVGVWIATFVNRRLWRWRRPAAYLASAMVLTVGIVGLLKTITNVDCPWDLLPFGGKFPYEPLFADRPDGLRHAQCFPAAHASSGYSLMALYFLARERSGYAARLGLIVGIVTGLVFGLAQQSRGAHFLSHDLCSAMLAWLIPSALYSFAFRRRAWSAKNWPPTAQSVHSSGFPSIDAESPINAPAGSVTALP